MRRYWIKCDVSFLFLIIENRLELFKRSNLYGFCRWQLVQAHQARKFYLLISFIKPVITPRHARITCCTIETHIFFYSCPIFYSSLHTACMLFQSVLIFLVSLSFKFCIVDLSLLKYCVALLFFLQFIYVTLYLHLVFCITLGIISLTATYLRVVVCTTALGRLLRLVVLTALEFLSPELHHLLLIL